MRPLHDPFELIPAELPGRPRIALTAEEVVRARQYAESYAWAREGKQILVAKAEAGLGTPVEMEADATGLFDAAQPESLMDQAIAYILTGRADHAEHAISMLRSSAERQDRLVADGKTAGSNQLGGSHAVICAAGAYDLLHDAAPMSDADRELIEQRLLRRGIEMLRDEGHFTCSNIRTWTIAALMNVALCLDDREILHEALYGRFDEDRNQQTFGILHQISHDILADGFHWERSFSYHYYTLSAITAIAHPAWHCGIDLWHLELDALLRPEGHDLHRDYRPACRKTLKWLYDAPLYFAYPDGGCPEIHDSKGNLWCAEWYGPMYEVAYEVYGDPKYAWLLNGMYEYRLRERPEEDTWQEPRAWQGSMFSQRNWTFVTLATPELPAGEFSYEQDARVGVTGTHTGGCTLFPAAGYAVLRSDVRDFDAPCVTMFYGPHSAGHQHGCALHISVYARQQRLLVDGARFGYDNIQHLTWSNQTVAHNTVVVDEISMFPQCDHEGQNHQFEADTFYLGPETDGTLECFHAGSRLKAVRASNETVYDGVRLDRTTATVDARYVVDIFRVISDDEHLYDFPLHGVGELDAGTCTDLPDGLGDKIGYRHLENARRVSLPGPREVTWRNGETSLTAYQFAPAGSEMFTASDPTQEEDETPRYTSMVRVRGHSVVFVTVLEAHAGTPTLLSAICEDPDPAGTVTVRVAHVDGEELVVFSPDDGEHCVEGCTFQGQVALLELAEGRANLAETSVGV